MADDNEDVRRDGGQGTGAAAEAIALSAASKARADGYLEQQTRLARLQCENLLEQNAFELSHLKWRRLNDQMRGVLYIVGVIVALAVLAGLGSFVWNAANSTALVVETFSVPPDFAGSGLTGEVIASKVLDRLQAFQAQTQSNRAASSYANSWGNDIKVQIPNTGVSIGDVDRYLRQWLGHETHISGDIYRTAPRMLAVTARAGGSTSPTFTGNDADLDKLIQQAAESVYRATQPYRYAVYLDGHGRSGEALAVYNQLIATGSSLERGWALIGLANDMQAKGNFAAAIGDLRRAIAERPDLLLAYTNLSGYENNLGHDDLSLALLQEFFAHAKSGDDSMGKRDFAANFALAELSLASDFGDFRKAISVGQSTLDAPGNSIPHENLEVSIVLLCAQMHDAACTRRTYADLPPTNKPQLLVNRVGSLQIGEVSLHDWPGILALADREMGYLRTMGGAGNVFIHRLERPTLALAQAGLGHFAAADALIADCPADSDLCLRTRGQIRAAEGKWAAADYWFARAVADAPHTPFGYELWGEALLKKGDTARAIALFAKANEIAPHYADPLEQWGEALMAEKRSDLAVGKFEEADKYAPEWGRLHLKWGEALVYAGDKSTARKQFFIATGLGLTEKSIAEGEQAGREKP
jgi:tetratricopeptide (TPR) repeat protein